MNTNQFREAFMQDVEYEFNEWWKVFSKEQAQRIRISNERIFKVFASIKGKQFLIDFKALSKVAGEGIIRLSKSPKGLKMRDKRWSEIPEIWVNQKSTNEGIEGEIYVQIRGDKWAYIRFSN